MQDSHESQKVKIGNTALHVLSPPTVGEYSCTDRLQELSVNKRVFWSSHVNRNQDILHRFNKLVFFVSVYLKNVGIRTFPSDSFIL